MQSILKFILRGGAFGCQKIWGVLYFHQKYMIKPKNEDPLDCLTTPSAPLKMLPQNPMNHPSF